MTKEEIQFFDRISTTWDDEEIRSTPERVKSILKKVNIKKGERVLDLGTGTGVLIPYLSELVGEEGLILGIDISSGMLKRAVEKYGGLQNVRFIKKDFEREEIDGMFDLVLLYCVYPHLHEPTDTIRKLLNNNVADGGRIIVAFPSDEMFINNIHREKKAESDMLPPAQNLCERFVSSGFDSTVMAYSPDEYVVEIRPVRNQSCCGTKSL